MGDWKDSVRVATTVPIVSLSGTLTIDTIPTNANDRVLVKNQSTASQNGIWVVSAGAWSRALDADVNGEINPEMMVRVAEGEKNAQSAWVLTTTGTITVGTTALSFERLDRVVDAALFPGTDAGDKINKAIQSLSQTVGGAVDATGLQGQSIATQIVVDRPVRLLLGAGTYDGSGLNTTAMFSVTRNFSIEGLDRRTTTLTGPTNAAVFLLSGTAFWTAFGQAHFSIKRMTLLGSVANSASVVFDTSNLSTSSFNEGMFLIEDNSIQAFGGVAFTFGVSVYYHRIIGNYFYNNKGCVKAMMYADGVIEHNFFDQASGGGPSLTIVAPNVHVESNSFARSPLTDTATEPDILLQPLTGQNASSGGYIWIAHNKFNGERENLNQNRSRIRVEYAADQAAVAAPVWIHANFFVGPKAESVSSISRDAAGVVTVTLSGARNAAVGGRVGILGVADVSFNGVYDVASTPTATSFTYVQSPSPGAATSYGGTVALANSRAIHLVNPIDRWDVRDNVFVNYGIIVDDAQAFSTSNSNRFGVSRFEDNHIVPSAGLGYGVFRNGGRQFTSLRLPGGAPEMPRSTVARDNEAYELRNRIKYSEDFSQSVWVRLPNNAHFTITNLQADPYGTTRASLISRIGTVANEQIYQQIDGTSLRTQVVVKFWAKEGTANTVIVAIQDATVSAFVGERETFNLTSSWKQYKFVATLQDVGHIHRIIFYPFGTEAVASNFYLFGVQVSDYDSDYLPTQSSYASDVLAGNRYERNVRMGSAAIVANAHVSISGTSPDVSRGNNFSVDNGSAVSVVDFLNAVNGQDIALYFSNGNSTLVHAIAKLRLKGGVNVTPAADQMVVLSRVAGVWVEKSRSF